MTERRIVTNDNADQVGGHLWCPGKCHHPSRVLTHGRHIGEDGEGGRRPCDTDVKGCPKLRLIDAWEALSSSSRFKVAGSPPTLGVLGSIEAPHTVIQGARIGDGEGEMTRLKAG